MANLCAFSKDRDHRYTLMHRWDELYDQKVIIWIGLNPSTADEQKLDPTLRRIKNFSQAWGYTAFVMLNLFAYRSTNPDKLLKVDDPNGPENNAFIYETLKKYPNAPVVAAWGVWGETLKRGAEVLDLIQRMGRKVECLGHNANGTPNHPLYISKNRTLQPITMGKLRDIMPLIENSKERSMLLQFAEKQSEVLTQELLELRIEQAPKESRPALQGTLTLMTKFKWTHVDLTLTRLAA